MNHPPPDPPGRNDSTTDAVDATAELRWMLPGHRPAAAQALARIQAICRGSPDLFSAVWVVAATHPAVPNRMLAAALRSSHPDAATLSDGDVESMLVAVRTAAREAFDAMVRTRRRAARGAAAASWLGNGD